MTTNRNLSLLCCAFYGVEGRTTVAEPVSLAVWIAVGTGATVAFTAGAIVVGLESGAGAGAVAFAPGTVVGRSTAPATGPHWLPPTHDCVVLDGSVDVAGAIVFALVTAVGPENVVAFI